MIPMEIDDRLFKTLIKDEAHKIVHVYSESPKIPELGDYVKDATLSDSIKSVLLKRGIERFFKFQQESIDAIRRGEDTIIIASTGMGKTEAFLLPIIEDILEHPHIPGVRALLIYPTKALARDQLLRINELCSIAFGMRALTLDGDTPEALRKRIYEYPPQILLTNPDMIHYSLVYSPSFRKIISNVKYIVLDDLHVYTGVFGAQVAYVLRRLERHLKSPPQYIGATATLGNPEETGRKLFRRDVRVIRALGGRRGTVYHIFIKPVTRPKLVEAVLLTKTCVDLGLKTIVFADSHRMVELMVRLGKKYSLDMRVHRAGLAPEERTLVEKLLKSGKICAVAATPTLELGIDIGDLDCVILTSIPSTYSKYIQRTGRCGRRGQTSYILTILGDDPISQYYELYPKDFFFQEDDYLAIDLQNPEVTKIHIISMAKDRSIRIDELSEFERQIAEELVQYNLLRKTKNYYMVTRKGSLYLRDRMNLRSIGERVLIFDRRGRFIGSREMPMALKELHPGAIYFHGGRTYIVIEFEKRNAIVEELKEDIDLMTTPLYFSEPEYFKEISSRKVYNLKVSYGELSVMDIVYGYVMKELWSGRTVSENLLKEELRYRFRTKGILIQVPFNPEWSSMSNAKAFHTIEHVVISVSRTIIGASHTDLGGISYPSGHIYIYDTSQGGSGLSLLLMNRLEIVLKRALNLLMACKCIDGCPRCIYSPYCGNNNEILSRRLALEVLREIIHSPGKLKLYASEERTGRPIA